jgi:predicted RNase H-like nuclease
VGKELHVAGVDGCKKGWLVGIFSVNKGKYKMESLTVAKNFEEVVSKTEKCKVVCIDIPIGLSEDERPRGCDVEARKILGFPRASSVFPPPVRQCLSAKNYREACDISLKAKGKKLSKQSFFIMDKIRQVDELITPVLQKRIREIHSEVSFWALNGGKTMRYKKQRRIGRHERLKVLSRWFENISEETLMSLKPKGSALDDVVDVFVAGLTAAQLLRRHFKTLPEKQEVDSRGLRMEIVYPA